MRFQTSTPFTTGSVAAGTALAFDVTVGPTFFNLIQLLLTPSLGTGPSRVEVYNTAASAAIAAADNSDAYVLNPNRVYATDAFAGSIYDPMKWINGQNPNPGNYAFIEPYEDLDATGKLHFVVYNRDTVAKTYTQTTVYEEVGVMSASGVVTFRGGVTVAPSSGDGAVLVNVVGTTATAHSIVQNLTDSTFVEIDVRGSTVSGGNLFGLPKTGMVDIILNPLSSSVAAIGTFNNTPLVFGVNSLEAFRIIPTTGQGSNVAVTSFGTPSPISGSPSVSATVFINGYKTTNAAQLQVNDSAALAQGIGGKILLGGTDGALPVVFGGIEGFKENATNGDYAGALVFKTLAYPGTGNIAEVARLTSTGSLLINTTTQISGDGPSLLVIKQTTGVGNYALDIQGNTDGVAAGSFGVAIHAGTQVNDGPLNLYNYANVPLFRVRGNGWTNIGNINQPLGILHLIDPLGANLYIDTVSDTAQSVVRFRRQRATGGTTQANDLLGDIQGVGYTSGATYNAAATVEFAQDGAATSTLIPGRIVFYTNDGATNNIERMRITAAGNVGINNQTPLNWVTIGTGNTTFEPTITVINSNTTPGARTQLVEAVTAQPRSGATIIAGIEAVYTGAGASGPQGQLSFYTNHGAISGETLAMTINSLQQVGIGTATPTELLHVSGGRSLFDSTTYGTGQQFAVRAKRSDDTFVNPLYQSPFNQAQLAIVNDGVSGTVNDILAGIDFLSTFYSSGVAQSEFVGARILARYNNIVNADIQTDLLFLTAPAGQSTPLLALTLDHSQNATIGGTGLIVGANGTGQANLVLGLNAPTANNSGSVTFQNSNTGHNWLFGANVNIAGSLEWTPSTATGGITFTNPVMLLGPTGNLILNGVGAAFVSAPDVTHGFQIRPATFGSDGLSITNGGNNATFVTIDGTGLTTFGYPVQVSGTIALGGYSLKAVGSSGADRNVFIAGISGVSNGFHVDYIGGVMQYVFNDLPVSSAGLPSGTLWNNSGVINVA